MEDRQVQCLGKEKKLEKTGVSGSYCGGSHPSLCRRSTAWFRFSHWFLVTFPLGWKSLKRWVFVHLLISFLVCRAYGVWVPGRGVC